ncbi:TraV family lipoprotein [Sphingomonas sp. H39-1-10]|uniref:TraV family lipoprotein n=1 Tax=Sphingomonas pollutisoli TaxID=3030829 RepID=UPI0023B8E3FD|nr:TraV family lipoprotein [Sphingomonas pollutisoli]MDF0490467.1 TraV family lipoprotein [Sphingomonas pollutisoli]
MSARATRPALGRIDRALLPIAALAGLGGCTSFLGGNVRGDFLCRAPGGTCAPSAMIDDQALGVIAPPEEARAEAPPLPERRSAGVRAASAAPARSREKVLRIVFSPYIDEQGWLHEASAVHAVVEQGDWQIPAAPGDAAAALAGPGQTLADAVDRPMAAEAPAAVASDPPSEAAVAAARARAPTSVEAIRADVEARIAQRRAEAASGQAAPSTPPPASVPAAPPQATPAPPDGVAPVVRAGTFPSGMEDPQ